MKTNAALQHIPTLTVTKLPHRMEPFGGRGWTVRTFANAREAAAWFAANGAAAMPCWKRLEVVDGELLQVR